MNMKLTAKQVSRTVYYADGRDRTFFKLGTFLIILASLLGSWGLISWRQTSGEYLCSTIFAQFGDDFLPGLGAFSGTFTKNAGIAYQGRVTYEKIVPNKGKAVFGCCQEERSWTFQVLPHVEKNGTLNDGHDSSPYSRIEDPCLWDARSAETNSFVIESTDSLSWEVRNSEQRTVPLSVFQIRCYDCVRIDGFCGSGSCDTARNACMCDHVDRHGLRCEFRQPCTTIEVDGTFRVLCVQSLMGSIRFVPKNAFTFESSRLLVRLGTEGFFGRRKYSKQCTRLKPESLQVYNRPVYINDNRQLQGESATNEVDIVFFVGRRWVITTSALLRDFLRGKKSMDGSNATTVRDRLAEYMNSSFHAERSDYSVGFISEAVDIDTPTDIATPLGLEWLSAQDKATGVTGMQVPDKFWSVDAIFLCAVCDDIANPCKFEGMCLVAAGSCDCVRGSSGTLCQIPPSGNGRCDPFFNTPEFSYDGGDCCQNSCISTSQCTCGKDAKGYSDVGYPNCVSDSSTWTAAGEPIEGTVFSRLGSSVALIHGAVDILVVSVPGDKTIRLYDRNEYEWVQRGAFIEGVEGPIAAAPADFQAVNNPVTLAPVIIATPDRVFFCDGRGCRQVGDDFPASTGKPSLSTDGRILVAEHGAYEWRNTGYGDQQRGLGSPRRDQQNGNSSETLASEPTMTPSFFVPEDSQQSGNLSESSALEPTSFPTSYPISETPTGSSYSPYTELTTSPSVSSANPALQPTNAPTLDSTGNLVPAFLPTGGPSASSTGTLVPAPLSTEGLSEEYADSEVPSRLSLPGVWIKTESSFYPGAVALSADGTTLAMGYAMIEDGDGASDGYKNFAGQVTFEVSVWNATEAEWTMLGGHEGAMSWDFQENCYQVFLAEFQSTFQSDAVSVSTESGKIVLATGLVWNYQEKQGCYVFEWTKDGWSPRGDRIGSLVCWSLSLSSDGSRLFIGVGPLDPAGASSEVFDWDGVSWKQSGSIAGAGSESSIDLSGDGSTLAVGLPFSTLDKRGSAQVFELPKRDSGCPEGSALVRVSVTTDVDRGDNH